MFNTFTHKNAAFKHVSNRAEIHEIHAFFQKHLVMLSNIKRFTQWKPLKDLSVAYNIESKRMVQQSTFLSS